MQAEATALKRALIAAHQHGITHINVYGDCATLLDILQNNCTTSNTQLAQLCRTIKSILDQFTTYDLYTITRDSNQYADGLAHAALD